MTTEKQAEIFFVSQALSHAQSLPLSQAQCFLKGLLLLTEDREETEPLRSVYQEFLTLSDHIESLQLKLI